MQGLDDKVVVPYIVYEGEQVRNERNIKRLVIALVITIMLLFATNALWISTWLQYDYVGEEVHTVDVDAEEGVANYIGNNGSIVNGADSGYDSKAESTAKENE